MPLMGGLYVGQSGLQAGQNALNTTAHNLSNVNTPGYTRQQILLGDRTYNTVKRSAISAQQVGLGVKFDGIRQVRSNFLDQNYRKEVGRSAFYGSAYEAISEVETVMGEINQSSFAYALSDLWTAIQELQRDPSSSINHGLLVSKADAFLKRADLVYSGLTSYQDNLNKQIKGAVDEINEYGNRIYELNQIIKRVELGGVENANDYRDERNRLLDQLAEYADIKYKEDPDGDVTVTIEGVPFITRDRMYEMGYKTDTTTGFHSPTWPQNNDSNVFDIHKEISVDLGTDVGKLKSLVLLRGDHASSFLDMFKGATAQDQKDFYNENIDPSLLMKTQAELDQLIHGVATAVNDVLCMNIGQNPDGPPLELFVRLNTERFEKDAAGNYKVDASGNYIVIPENYNDYSTVYTIRNLKINPDLIKSPSLLGFVKNNVEDRDRADALKKAFEKESLSLNPNLSEKKYNFINYYSAVVSDVASEGAVYGHIYTNQRVTVASKDNARQSIMGVSTDEELTNMIKFQNAYNASSRYVNVVDEMLEHLLTKLG